jgi:hypothetical protein
MKFRHLALMGIIVTGGLARGDSLDGSVFLFPISSSSMQFKSFGTAEYINAVSQRIYEPIGGNHSVRGPQVFTTSYYAPTGAYGDFLEGPADAGACYSTHLEGWAFGYFGSHIHQNSWNGPDTKCAPNNPPPGDPPPADACDHCTGGGMQNEPLILDLNGDGIWTTSKAVRPVWFDLNGNGVADLTAWTDPDHEDAFLYVDWNRNRTIDGGRELFGDATIMPNGARASHGYEALAAYDDPLYGGNGDGKISSADRIWSRLRLWVDRNHDGLVTPSENFALPDARVVSIALEYEVHGPEANYGTDSNGNWHLMQGTYTFRDRGRVRERAMHEVWFIADLR